MRQRWMEGRDPIRYGYQCASHVLYKRDDCHSLGENMACVQTYKGMAVPFSSPMVERGPAGQREAL